MDELEELARARPVPPPSAELVARSRTALIQLAGSGRSRHRRTLNLRPRILVPIVVPALAVAVGIVVIVNLGGTGAPNATGSATTPSAPPSKPAASPAWDSTNAPQLLLVAAEQAQHQAAAGNANYWVSTVERGTLVQVGAQNNRYAIMTRWTEITWKPLVPGKDVVRISRWAGAAPASEADKAAWRAAGSPATWPKDPPPGCRPDPSNVYTAAPGGPETVVRSAPNFQLFMVVGESLTVDQIRALPSDPEKLRKWLLGVIEKQNLPRRNAVQAGEALFAAVVTLVLGTPITPAVRAAAFRVLAGVPGIRSLGTVTDAKGRFGVAVSVKSNDTVEEQRANSGGPMEDSLLFDPDTGEVLGRHSRALRPADYMRWVPAGALFTYELVENVRWTGDEPPAASTNSQSPTKAPWLGC